LFDEPRQDRTEGPDAPRVMLAGEMLQVNPLKGDIETAKLTVPEYPLTLKVVTVVLPWTVAFALTLVGLALIAKSWTVKFRLALRDNVPLAPVTVTK
jgi:hypothetical protein